MSWLSTMFDNNRNFIGNGLKNIAPIAGILTGGLGGVALGGLGAALGQGLEKGSNIGDILKTGASNAAITGLGQGVYGGLKGAFAGSGAAGGAGGGAGEASTLSGHVPMPSEAGALNGGLDTPMGQPFNPMSGVKLTSNMGPPPGVVGPLSNYGPSSSGGGFGSSADVMSKMGGGSGTARPSLFDRATGFADRHMDAIGAGLKGIGGMGQNDAETRYMKSRTAQQDLQTQIDSEQWELQKRRNAALQPLLASLMGTGQGQINQPINIAPNPYRPGSSR